MLTKLRPLWNQIVDPLGQISRKLGLSPDVWTVFSLFCSIVGSVFLYHHKFWWGLIWIILMLIADMLDGATARAVKKSSKFGTVFDHVIDRYAEIIIFSGMLIGESVSIFSGIFALSGIIMASYVRAKAESSGGLKDCTVGIAGRVEKLLVTYGAVVFLALGFYKWAELSFLFIGVISHATAIQRLFFARSVINAEI